jgi:hypothetical protein
LTPVVRTISTICFGAFALVACAHVEPPRGGPPDEDPPEILITRPDPGAVVPRYDGPVLFQFDERISERGVEDAVMVSPRTSPVEVRHGRQEVRVSLRRGWQPNTIYHVTLRPEIVDLFGNRMTETTTLVFSTGPEIPDTRSGGLVTDRLTGRPEEGIRVEAIRTADSLVYAVPTDTAGRFDLSNIPEGDYLYRAFEDMNRNRSLEFFEPRDSAFAAVRENEAFELAFRILAPDTTPPVAGSAQLRQRRLDIEFDDHLDPDQDLTLDQVVILSPDGTRVDVARLGIGTLPPQPEPDTAAADPAQPPAPLPPPAPVAPAPGAPPEPVGPLPSRTLAVEIAEEADLEPETEYRVEIRGILNVNGLPGDSDVEFTTPPALPAPPAPPADPADPADPATRTEGPVTGVKAPRYGPGRSWPSCRPRSSPLRSTTPGSSPGSPRSRSCAWSKPCRSGVTWWR